jgi:hypothetical protein
MSTSAFAPLLPKALVGTDRHAGGWPVWPGEHGALIAEVSVGDTLPATALLRMAGVLALCHLAGSMGRPAAEQARPGADPEVLLPLEDPRLLGLMEWVLQQGPVRLAGECLAVLSQRGLRLPAALLPTVLDASRRATALRPWLAPVLGTTGCWLAAQREDWKHAVGVQTIRQSDEVVWLEGSLEQRSAFLLQERSTVPDVARERLIAALPELAAQERLELVQTLGVGLSLQDEPLLERLRANDRGREVRQAALRLLLRLPLAAHPQRAMARLAPLVVQHRGLIHKRWVVEAPAAAADDWAADQVEAKKPPHESLGERAWWLYQLASQVPLSWWSEHTGMRPKELLAWSAQGDWNKALTRAWFEVLLATPDSDWADAFIHASPDGVKGLDIHRLVPMLSRAARDARWERLLQQGEAGVAAVLPELVTACELQPGNALARLSPGVSNRLVAWVQDRLAAQDAHLQWVVRNHLPDLCCIVDASALPALRALPRSADETAAMAELMHALAQIIATREALETIR